MTTLPPAPSVIKTILFWDVGKPKNASSHVYWHTTSGPVVTADLTAVAGTVASVWNAQMGPHVPTTTVLTEVVAEDLGHPDTIPGAWSGSHAGAYPTAGQSAEVATLINFTIARRYRGGKPRIYLPQGVSAQLNNPVSWQSTYISEVNADWANFVAGVISASPASCALDKQVNVSYHSGGVLRPSPVIDTILGFATNPTPASQRRRMAR